jgi:hypothetical protein
VGTQRTPTYENHLTYAYRGGCVRRGGACEMPKTAGREEKFGGLVAVRDETCSVTEGGSENGGVVDTCLVLYMRVLDQRAGERGSLDRSGVNSWFCNFPTLLIYNVEKVAPSSSSFSSI